MQDARAFLDSLFTTAVAAAHPAAFLPRLLPEAPTGRVVLLAAGKAAGSMAEVAERIYLDERGLGREKLTGIAVARHGYGRPTKIVEMVEAGHPIPDAAGLAAAERAIALADSAGSDDLVCRERIHRGRQRRPAGNREDDAFRPRGIAGRRGLHAAGEAEQARDEQESPGAPHTELPRRLSR